MAYVELFGKGYKIKDFNCAREKNGVMYKRAPSVILYIKIDNSCNAKCEFCLNKQHKEIGNIDLDKLKYIVTYLNEKRILASVTITGGEPMLNPKKVNDVINTIVSVVPKICISISTNGTNIKKILEFDNIKNIEAIHISRHHYLDSENDRIFNCNTILSEDIRYVQEKLKNIIINIVMFKKGLNSVNDIKNICEWAVSLKIRRIHLVSLINYNSFCMENFVDVKTLVEECENQKILTKFIDYYRFDNCECHYYYFNNNDMLNRLLVMSRYVKYNEYRYVEQLVYTNENKLLTGFDGEEIEYDK